MVSSIELHIGYRRTFLSWWWFCCCCSLVLIIDCTF